MEEYITTDEQSRMEQTEFLEYIMNHYGDEVFRLTYSYVRNRATAEDLTQEVFVKCYMNYSKFEGKSKVRTWIYRIAINHCKDYLKSWSSRTLWFTNLVEDFVGKNEKSTEEVVLASHDYALLGNLVLKLPVKYREVIILYYYQELKIQEISNMLQMNTNTIKVRLKRAKDLLETAIQKEESRNGGKIKEPT